MINISTKVNKKWYVDAPAETDDNRFVEIFIKCLEKKKKSTLWYKVKKSIRRIIDNPNTHK